MTQSTEYSEASSQVPPPPPGAIPQGPSQHMTGVPGLLSTGLPLDTTPSNTARVLESFSGETEQIPYTDSDVEAAEAQKEYGQTPKKHPIWEHGDQGL